jgi:hypothetical protein
MSAVPPIDRALVPQSCSYELAAAQPSDERQVGTQIVLYWLDPVSSEVGDNGCVTQGAAVVRGCQSGTTVPLSSFSFRQSLRIISLVRRPSRICQNGEDGQAPDNERPGWKINDQRQN